MVVTEFYANASTTTSVDAFVRTVSSMQESFNPELINKSYGLLDMDNKVYKGRERVRENQ